MAPSDRSHVAPSHDEWHVTVGRALGRATRMTAREIEIFRRTIVRVRDSFLPEVGPRRRPLSLSLKKLGEVVARHADQDYVTLQNDPVFWALIREVHASQPVARPTRIRRRAPKRLGKGPARAAKRPVAKAGSKRGSNSGDGTSTSEFDSPEGIVDAVGHVEAETATVAQDSEATPPSRPADEAEQSAAGEAEQNAVGEAEQNAAGEAEQSAAGEASPNEEGTKEQPE